MTSEPGPLEALYETDADPAGVGDAAPGQGPGQGTEPAAADPAAERGRLNIEAIIASGAVW